MERGNAIPVRRNAHKRGFLGVLANLLGAEMGEGLSALARAHAGFAEKHTGYYFGPQMRWLNQRQKRRDARRVGAGR